jgi:hypothetical protein
MGSLHKLDNGQDVIVDDHDDIDDQRDTVVDLDGVSSNSGAGNIEVISAEG